MKATKTVSVKVTLLTKAKAFDLKTCFSLLIDVHTVANEKCIKIFIKKNM